MHPPIDALLHGLGLDPPSSAAGGRGAAGPCLRRVRPSSSPTGSNSSTPCSWSPSTNTAEPTTTSRALRPPPGPSLPGRAVGFQVRPVGARVPDLAVSAWMRGEAVVTRSTRHTSVIRTLRERWPLGHPLTGRDGRAGHRARSLSLDSPRDPADWPEVMPRRCPRSPGSVSLEARLKGLCKAAVLPGAGARQGPRPSGP